MHLRPDNSSISRIPRLLCKSKRSKANADKYVEVVHIKLRRIPQSSASRIMWDHSLICKYRRRVSKILLTRFTHTLGSEKRTVKTRTLQLTPTLHWIPPHTSLKTSQAPKVPWGEITPYARQQETRADVYHHFYRKQSRPNVILRHKIRDNQLIGSTYLLIVPLDQAIRKTIYINTSTII